MAVPKSKRRNSKPEFFHFAYKMITELTKFLLNDFGITDRNNDFMLFCRKCKISEEDMKELATLTEKYRFSVKISYSEFVIDYYRNKILDISGEILDNISLGYSMYPTTVYEYNVRKQYIFNAIAYCYTIKHNLQLVVELFSVNLEKYIPFISMIDHEIDLLKKWKKHSTSLKNKCYENDELEKEKAKERLIKIKENKDKNNSDIDNKNNANIRIERVEKTKDDDSEQKNTDLEFLNKVLGISISTNLINNNILRSMSSNDIVQDKIYVPACYIVNDEGEILNYCISGLEISKNN